eukprot:g33697.t1
MMTKHSWHASKALAFTLANWKLVGTLNGFASPRREAIQRMDSMLHRFEPERPYHETRQYVALQLAHLALTKHPRLKDEPFYKLEELCPDLCQEDCISKYYSEKVLAQGQSSFQAPDRQPLPTKLESAASRWHQDLDDQDFLKAVQSKTLSSWNLPSLARELRRAPEVQTGLFTHETLAYFTIHMIHYFSATEKLSTSEPFSEFIKKLALYGKKALSFSRVSLQCSIYAFAFAGLFVGCPGFATLSEYRGRLPCYLLNINRRKCDKILDASLYKAYYSEGTIHCPEAATSFAVESMRSDEHETWAQRRMISFTETELGVGEGNDEEDLTSEMDEAIHEPSLSLRAQRLLAPTSCTGWKEAVIPRNPHIDHPLVRSMLTRACQAVLDSEQELNTLDAATADGDLGRNMARAAQLIMASLNDGLLPMARPALLFFRLADFLRGVDGTLSALLSVFFGRAARYLTQRGVERLQRKVKSHRKSRKRAFHLPWIASDVYCAFCAGEQEVEAVAESSEGQRTFLDSLLPALRAAGKNIHPKTEDQEGELCLPLYDDEDDLELSHLLAWGRQSSIGSEQDILGDVHVPWDAIATAAQEGARATASMKSTPCYGGFLGDCDFCDGGAMVVAIVLTAMAGPSEGLLQVTKDEEVKQVLDIGDAWADQEPSQGLPEHFGNSCLK